MPNQPQESYPGAIIRFPGLVPEKTANGEEDPEDDIIGRGLVKKEEQEGDETTILPVKKSEPDDSIIFTRKGFYRMVEGRLSS